jgi:hypothetical protein
LGLFHPTNLKCAAALASGIIPLHRGCVAERTESSPAALVQGYFRR